MRWAGSPMAGSSLCEDWPLECTMKLDEGTSELSNHTLAIALRVRLTDEGKRTSKRKKKKRLTKYVSGCSCNCMRTTISSSCAWSGERVRYLETI
jgi:hypothetical protein